ncbi:hypothetical protein ACNQPY_26225 [Mycobacteroides abscessus]|uniref:hypothetical protein n=1 Tax=Mycobacteroides abscessus TaxID=36809 RepID=UPI003AAB5A3F
MFDVAGWDSSGMYPTLVAADRPVMIDGLRAFFGAGGGLMSGVPLGVRSAGLRVDPWMPGRQRLWLRVRDGSWLAGVELVAESGNGSSRLNMQLWLPPTAFVLDSAHRP